MTKNELIAAVADKAQMTKTAAATAVDATFDAITSTLKRGGEVKIMGFGNFRVVKRAAREGRDPRTGAPVKIKAAKRPRFSAARAAPCASSSATGCRATRRSAFACPASARPAGTTQPSTGLKVTTSSYER